MDEPETSKHRWRDAGARDASDASDDGESFRLLVESSVDLISRHAPDGVFLYASPACHALIGYAPGDLVGRSINDLAHPEDADDVRRRFEALRQSPGPQTFTYRVRREDGSVVWLETSCRALGGAGAREAMEIVCVSRDVTEKSNEEALRRSEREYHDFFGLANDAIIIYEPESRAILDVNKSACRMYGIPRETFVGMTMKDLSQDPVRARRYLKELLEKGSYRDFETLHRRADGRLINVVANSSVIEFHGRRAVLSIYRDVTESKMMEVRLREAEARYRTLVEQIPAVVYVQQIGARSARTASQTTYISPQMERMQGYAPEECIEDPEHWRKTLHPDDRERVLAEDERTDATGEPFVLEYRQIAKNGRVVWVRDEAILVRDEAGDPLYWQGVLLDITDRKRAEEALAASESRFRATFEQAAVGMAHVATDGRWLVVNQKLCDIVGYTCEELLGLTFQDITHPDDLDANLDYVRRLLSGEIDTYTIEKRYLKKDGAVVWAELTGSLVRHPSGEPDYFISVVEDITRRKRLEESLREIRVSERRRIARDLHDVVLQDLAGALQGMQAARIEGADLDPEIEALRRAVGGLRGAIYNLRLDGRRPFLRSVESLIELNRQLTPEREIRLSVTEAFPPELPDRVGAEVLRILQEALVNARRHSDARRVEVSLQITHGTLRAEVSDDGRGFDPASVRAGVGISGMRERALALGGKLEIRSAPGAGASVIVEVPVSAS